MAKSLMRGCEACQNEEHGDEGFTSCYKAEYRQLEEMRNLAIANVGIATGLEEEIGIAKGKVVREDTESGEATKALREVSLVCFN